MHKVAEYLIFATLPHPQTLIRPRIRKRGGSLLLLMLKQKNEKERPDQGYLYNCSYFYTYFHSQYKNFPALTIIPESSLVYHHLVDSDPQRNSISSMDTLLRIYSNNV